MEANAAQNGRMARIRSLQPSKEIYAEDDISENEEHAFTPVHLLRHGNSDPFCSFPIHLDPLVNELIRFEETWLRPAMSGAQIERLAGRRIAYWDDAKTPAANQIAIYAYLSRAAALVSTATPDPRYARMSLVYKGKSLRLLQDQIASTTVQNMGDIAENVMALQKAELFAHNAAGTFQHTKFLAALLQQQRLRSGLDTHLFFSAVYTDLQSSAMSLTRPHFDISPNSWVTEELRNLGGKRGMPSELDDDDLDASIAHGPLRCIFAEIRSLAAASQALTAHPPPGPALQVATTSMLLCTGRLVTFYLAHYTEAGAPKPTVRRDEHAQVCACLAALHWTRAAAKIDSMPVGASRFYAAGPLILSRLREALALAPTLSANGDDEEEEEDVSGSRLRFWVLSVGAFAEQTGFARSGAGVKGQVDWFTAELAKQAARMGIFSWQQAREILSGFLYTDVLTPHGSTWFSKIFDRPFESGAK